LTEKKAERTTSPTQKWRFSGLRAFGSRVSVFLGGYERSPNTQPFHIVKPLADTLKDDRADKIG